MHDSRFFNYKLPTVISEEESRSDECDPFVPIEKWVIACQSRCVCRSNMKHIATAVSQLVSRGG